MFVTDLKLESIIIPLCTVATVISQRYQPAKDRQKPQMLEMALFIAPSTSTVISFQFNRAFLKWTEHPPDAHHGFYIK